MSNERMRKSEINLECKNNSVLVKVHPNRANIDRAVKNCTDILRLLLLSSVVYKKPVSLHMTIANSSDELA